MVQPKVSVVIPNFNYAPFLSEAIDSVLRQSFQDFEVIVVDNFSTDGSDSVAASFRDPRIRFVSFANMGSIARARNRGIELALGEYVAFLDSDDKWHPNKLELQLERMHENAITYHPLEFFGARRRGKTSAWKVTEPTLENLLRGGNPVSTSSVIVARELLMKAGLFPEDQAFYTVEDYCLWLSLAANGAEFVLIPEALGRYRIHGSASSKVDGTVGLRQFVTLNFDAIDIRTKVRFDGFLGYMQGLYLLKNGIISDARMSFREALMNASFRFRWRAALRLILLVVSRGHDI
ncbi:MAG: hypothetical protein RIS08_1282 [Actinomycetota bacterium]|jgi:glycosyltransferase involved in cell wall biosynthesis